MPGTNLTQAEAAARAATVRDVAYSVELDLASGPTTFGSRTTITFDATPGADTFLDLVAPEVTAVTLNGRELDAAAVFADSRIALESLAEHNTVVVDARCAYTNTGEGMHRFVDPADGEVYLYTQFEIPDARRVFATFEQPDLKAEFTFTVTAPAAWDVVSCSPTPEPVPAGTRDGVDVATWSFAPTPRISTYITAVIAGPYDRVTSSVTCRAGEIPLGVLSRRSLTPYVDHDEVFDITRRGFEFFEAEFDQPFPFVKYDQVFTPEYNMGAMENVGAVTYNEIYVFRSKVTEAVVERRALTILHELAHMWFGNLVTLRWWNDLWLNESFAEWASTTAQAEATRWTTAWTTFSSSEKAWAYREDQLASTHPISAPMGDLKSVEQNFDGITYAKGASVLKQLVAYVGRDAFREGLRSYFREFAWGNTEFDDLLRHLAAASGRDLSGWAGAWLETAGVATLSPAIGHDGGVITSFAVRQSAPEQNPTLRPHRLGIGGYERGDDGVLRREWYVEADVDGESTDVPDVVGRPLPALLLVNDQDLAYAKIRLDDRSLAAVRENPRALEDSLARTLVLASAWDMTRDGELPARDLVDILLPVLDGETDSSILRTLLGQLTTAATTYTAPAHQEETSVRVAGELWRLAQAAPAGSDAQLQLTTAFAGLARTDEHLDVVAGLLDETRTLEGLAVDADLRWKLLASLAAGNRTDADRIETERRGDNTASGNEYAALALAALATPEAKAAAWERGVVRGDESNKVIESTGIGFGRVHDAALLDGYTATYLDSIEDVWARHSFALAEDVAETFFPLAGASADQLAAVQAWLAGHTDADQGLRRVVGNHRDTIARTLAAQERDAAR